MALLVLSQPLLHIRNSGRELGNTRHACESTRGVLSLTLWSLYGQSQSPIKGTNQSLSMIVQVMRIYLQSAVQSLKTSYRYC